MNHLTMVKRKREEKASKKRERANSDMSAEGQSEASPEKEPPMSRNPYDTLDRARSSSLVAEGNYQTALDKYNESIEQFNENFTPIMKKIQEQDEGQTEFIKLKMDKFAGFISQFSNEMGK